MSLISSVLSFGQGAKSLNLAGLSVMSVATSRAQAKAVFGDPPAMRMMFAIHVPALAASTFPASLTHGWRPTGPNKASMLTRRSALVVSAESMAACGMTYTVTILFCLILGCPQVSSRMT